MKKAIKLTLAVVLVMGATSLFAQKFGRINTQEIIMAMPETKTMQELSLIHISEPTRRS